MRVAIQAAGCLIAFIAAIVGVFGIIGVLDPLLTTGARLISGGVAVGAIGTSFLIYFWLGRKGAAWSAQRSEQPGRLFGTKERSYRAVAFENAIGLFERDAASLATKGYRVSDAAWERSDFSHPVRHVVLAMLSLATGAAGSAGTLRATYETESTIEAAQSALDAWARELRARSPDGAPRDPFADLPFQMALPVGWERSELPPDTPSDVRTDAIFFARDPRSTDLDYFSTVLVMAREPTADPRAFLDKQEASLQAAEDSRRIALPAGEALVIRLTQAHEAQVQFFLPTTFAIFAIWFTTPVAELATRDEEFEAMARSFRLKT